MLNIFYKLYNDIYQLGLNIFLSEFMSLNSDIFINFILDNRYIYIFILMTYILLLFDNRFYSGRKIVILFIVLFIVILITVLLIIINIDNLPQWFSELYWYGKILHLAVLIHIIWLPWIYKLFWYIKWEKACWVISRISFILSLNFFIFILSYLDLYVGLLINNYVESRLWDNSIDSKDKDAMMESKARITMEEILIYEKIYHIIMFILCLIRTIVAYFIIFFHKYVIFILGFKDLDKIKFINWIYMFLFFIITLVLSYWILGVARLYVVWILMFLYNLYLIFNNHLNNYGNININSKYHNKLVEISYLKVLIDFFNIYLLSLYRYDVENEQKKILYEFYLNIYDTSYNHPNIHYLYLNENHNAFEFKSQAKCWQELIKFDSWLIWSWRALWNIWIKDYNYDFKKIRDLIKMYNKLKIIYNLNKNELEFLKEIFIRNIYILKKKGLFYNEISKLYKEKGYMVTDNKIREYRKSS